MLSSGASLLSKYAMDFIVAHMPSLTVIGIIIAALIAIQFVGRVVGIILKLVLVMAICAGMWLAAHKVMEERSGEVLQPLPSLSGR